MIFRKVIKKAWGNKYILGLQIIWTIGVTASALLNLHGVDKDTVRKALLVAKSISEHNLAYRKWNASHGGIYVRVTEDTQPNPYIFSDDKNLVTVDGIRLTMISPSQMTEETYALLEKNSTLLPIINKTVSLDPLNPKNIPDKWEKNALLAIQKGAVEVSEVVESGEASYIRLLTPYLTEENCIKCHIRQGYKIGDHRGGISVSVPIARYSKTASDSRNYIIISHIVLWIIGMFTIVLFFIGLRKYQQDIAESGNKFRIVSEFTHNLEYWINENNEFIFISPSCERVTGYSRDDFYNNPRLLLNITHPDDIEAYRMHLSDLKSSVYEGYQYRIITKKGEVRWLSHTCNPIYEEGNFLGRRGSIKDLTNQKILEDQLNQAQQLEYLGHFACGIAHDFNNILSSISTFAHLLEEEIREDNTDQKDYLKYINIASKLGKNLTSNLLAFGRTQVVSLKPIRLNTILKEISDILKSLLTEDIEYELSLTEDESLILADQHQIEQIIINLCTNARDAMVDGGKLGVRTEKVVLKEKLSKQFVEIPPGQYITLSVSDVGQGIRPENLSKIYEPFFTTKKKDKGTGLGLAIINNIVQQHNSHINVESEIGKGTKFTIFFPIITKNDDIQAYEEDAISLLQEKKDKYLIEIQKETNNKGKFSPTILLVEDDELVRKSLCSILQVRGYNIIVAEDGEKAVDQFFNNQDSIELIILDVMLPKKNGKEVYKAIKSHNKKIKALFISGFSDDIALPDGIDGAEYEYLQKPLNIDQFITKIEEILQA